MGTLHAENVIPLRSKRCFGSIGRLAAQEALFLWPIAKVSCAKQSGTVLILDVLFLVTVLVAKRQNLSTSNSIRNCQSEKTVGFFLQRLLSYF